MKTDIKPEVQNLRHAVGGEFEGEIIGYGVMISVGYDFNCRVPRRELIDRMVDMGLPQSLHPGPTSATHAYKRTMKWLREDWPSPYEVQGRKVLIDLREGDSKDIWHVQGNVLFSEDETGVPGGRWVSHDLGYFSYDRPAKMIKSHSDDSMGDDHALWEVWKHVSDSARKIFEEMKQCKIGGDIRRMTKQIIRRNPSIIKLRRAVYLFPAHLIDLVERLAELFRWIDREYKSTGEPMRIRTFEVLNTSDKQEWVEHRVRKTLKTQMDSILSSAFDEFDEGEIAERVVEQIGQNLGETEETAETYNSLLRAEISVEEILEEQKEAIENGKKEEIVDQVAQNL